MLRICESELNYISLHKNYQVLLSIFCKNVSDHLLASSSMTSSHVIPLSDISTIR